MLRCGLVLVVKVVESRGKSSRVVVVVVVV